MCCKKIFKNIISLFFSLFGTAGFAISVLYIMLYGNKYIDGPCTNLNFMTPNDTINKITITKDLSERWSWLYYNDVINIKQLCPTVTHDAKLLTNNKLIARTDGKFFNDLSTTFINDCTGTRKYIMKAASSFDAFINNMQIKVSYLLTDMNDTIIAYVEGSSFLEDNIDIKNINGTIIANIYRNIFIIPSTWEITIYDKKNEATKPEILLLITGKKTYSAEYVFTDMCNYYILSGIITTFLFIVTTLISCCVCIRNSCNKNIQQNKPINKFDRLNKLVIINKQ